MASAQYFVRQQFTLGAYKSLVDLSLPDENSPDYVLFLVYKARAHLALGDARGAAALVPAGATNVALRAVAAAAALAAAPASAREDALEPLREISLTLDDADTEGDAQDRGVARVLAGAAFAAAGETEEALETLGAGTQTENLEAVAYIVHIYLALARADLARAQFEHAKRWAEDDTLLQLIEASIGLATGRDGYADAASFYTEQVANPSVAAPRLLTARGIARLMKGDVQGARSDLDEALQQTAGADADAAAARAVAATLAAPKGPEASEAWTRLAQQFPAHPLAVDAAEKEASFDAFAANYTVPALAAA